MKHLSVPVIWAVLIAAEAAAAAPSEPTRSGPPPTAVPVPHLDSPRSVLLWDQTDNPAGGSIGSQDFEPAFDIFDDEAADDFVVPAGAFWSIDEAFISGGYNAGGGPAAAVNLYFYSDSGGTPGGVVCGYPLLNPIDGGGSFLITLPRPCVLRAGTYWVSAQARQDFGTNGQWYRSTRSAQNGSESRWRNPGNGYGTGCTSFTPVSSCVAGTAPDLLYWLAGTAGGVAPSGPPECATSAAYFENGTPVAIPDEGGPVATSTLGVSGLTGTIWDVNALTFITHTFPGDLDMTIQSPAGTVVTLSTDNGGSNDDTFNGTVWDDQANPGGQVPYAFNAGLVNDHPYAAGVSASPLAPEEALSAFIGEDPNGTWTLTIDDDAGGDVGSLNAWGLQITTLQSTITTSSTSPHANNVPVPIPDVGGGVISTIDASSHRGTFICQVKVTTDITHTFPGDLDMTLTSPAGTVVTLSTDNAGTSDNAFAGTTWQDGVNPGGQVPYASNDGLVNDTAYVNGTPVATLVPEEALAAFIGEDPRGAWTLTITDDAAGDVGTLNSWFLSITTCTCAHAERDAPLRVDEHALGGGSDLNGVFEAGETVQVEPSWHNPGSAPFDLGGFILAFDGPPGPAYTITDSQGEYGSIVPGATGNCFDATGNCYELTIGAGTRPLQHWDVTFQEAAFEYSARERPASPAAVFDWTLHVGESFPDVARGTPFYRFVETIFHRGVTGGCSSPPNYCPGDLALRKQMAVFVLKAKDGAAYVPPAAVGVFTDVPAADPFAPWIEELYNRGVVAGCGAGPTYCPNNPVLRQQMAIFLLKALLGSSYMPPAAVGMFGDVPISSPFAPWIEDLFNRGIAAGCGGGNFCPTNSTTRGQMAPFLVKSFGLTLYGP